MLLHVYDVAQDEALFGARSMSLVSTKKAKPEPVM